MNERINEMNEWMNEKMEWICKHNLISIKSRIMKRARKSKKSNHNNINYSNNVYISMISQAIILYGWIIDFVTAHFYYL